ncbi:hypothetical protein GCM10010441_25480 [Kitasatospora paracochleata]|uniref:Ribosomal protein S18 acetylase RimI-like enzyme n=1 Tax=Kitasatospora paracochleata TaxID=58354 RepID=A0ABT1J101_9ACTN|nr:GNAT family N-acetyltransferase [Kitasatospora paracochleata]MCP2311105.1 ribosomal protein S18 acetylase RimI-like enzyme [Kitasatospora paracochleata]
MSHVVDVMISLDPDDRAAAEELSRRLRVAAPWRGGMRPEDEVYAGVIDHADLPGLVAQVGRMPWRRPECVQLFVREQENGNVRIWRFHGRELTSDPDGGPPDIRTRLALATDIELLHDMLVAAVNWPPGRDMPREAVLADPHNAHYVDGWPRDGDLGVVAVATHEENRWLPVPVGAAWLRHFSEDDPGYGFIGRGVPELSIGIDAAHRGRGVGTLLIRRLLAEARAAGVERVSLSVERDNPAARLYRREGFRVHDPREGEAALTMLADLRGQP